MHGQLHWNVDFPFVFTQKLVLITHSIISATHDCRGGTRVTCPIGIQWIVAFWGVICRSFDSQGGGGTAILYGIIKVCAAVKGMVFKQLILGQGIEITEFGSRIGYHSPGFQQFSWLKNVHCSLDQGNQEFSSQCDIKVQCVGLSLFLEMVTLGQVHFCVEILGVQHALQFMVTKFSRTRSGVEEGFWGPSGTCPPKHS